MEIHLSADQQAHLAELADSAGRPAGEIVGEAVALWEERENTRALAQFRLSLDRAEDSIAEGGGRVITSDSMHDLAQDIHQRGLARLAAENKTVR